MKINLVHCVLFRFLMSEKKIHPFFGNSMLGFQNPSKLKNNLADPNGTLETILDTTFNRALNISPEKDSDNEPNFNLTESEDDDESDEENGNRKVVKAVSKSAVRRYNSNFIKYGFTSIEENGVVKPKCGVCLMVLGNSSMNPAKLKRHLKSHKEFAKKPIKQNFKLSKTFKF